VHCQFFGRLIVQGKKTAETKTGVAPSEETVEGAGCVAICGCLGEFFGTARLVGVQAGELGFKEHCTPANQLRDYLGSSTDKKHRVYSLRFREHWAAPRGQFLHGVASFQSQLGDLRSPLMRGQAERLVVRDHTCHRDRCASCASASLRAASAPPVEAPASAAGPAAAAAAAASHAHGIKSQAAGPEQWKAERAAGGWPGTVDAAHQAAAYGAAVARGAVPKLYGAAGSAAGAADIAWLCTQAALRAGCFAEQALRLHQVPAHCGTLRPPPPGAALAAF
jgi:hypothetical protein